jgi:hypothetical protein
MEPESKKKLKQMSWKTILKLGVTDIVVKIFLLGFVLN